MKKKWIAAVLLMSLLLSGCSWLDGSYVHVVKHKSKYGVNQNQTLTAEDEKQFCAILSDMVSSFTQTGTILVDRIPEKKLETILSNARVYLCEENPVGSFAVDDIAFELGTKQGRPAVAVSIAYGRSYVEILKIIEVADIAKAAEQVEQALVDCRSGIALKILSYTETDFVQMVADFAQKDIDVVMESPQVTEKSYGTGESRVVELNFSYENSREALRSMNSQVRPIFNAASLYVSGNGQDHQKLVQLFVFLTERFSYKVETSITPAYSLLCHGVGDSRAFALVYSAMCRSAGLECETVTGTRNGEPWVWNRVRDGENYYHVDLLSSSEMGFFREMREDEMNGYVWDYSLTRPSEDEEGSETAFSEEEMLIPEESMELVDNS